MGNRNFFEQQALFMMQQPEADPLIFLRQYITDNPAHDIGWFYYARELETRGELKKAYLAYRKCIRLHGEYHDQAIDAMIALQKRIHRKRRWLKRLLKPLLISGIALIAVLLPAFQLSSWLATKPFFSLSGENPANVSTSRQASGNNSGNISQRLPWIEVVSLQANDLNGSAPDMLQDKLKTYWSKRSKELGEPLMLIITDNEKLLPWTPHLFANPDKVLALVVPDPSGQPQWIDPHCSCEVPNYGDANVYAKSVIQHYEKQRIALENWLVLRSALYYFAQKNGELPRSLDDLIRPFPDNYLSGIPKWQPSSSLAIPQEKEQSVGYYPDAVDKKELWSSLAKVIPFYANEKNTLVPYPFQPLTVQIDKGNHQLAVLSGSFILRLYDVGLGKENRTPEGTFSVVKKINQPLSKTDVFGTRALVLSDERYAIHGTNDPASVGKYETLGCVRLHNKDIEELYSLLSLGTTVQIINGKDSPVISFVNPSPPFLLPARGEERDMSTYYHWLQ